jgi:hypothetical protein
MKTAFIPALAVIAVLMPVAGRASDQGKGVIQYWKGADKCTLQARQLFPDYTAESNTKRDAALKSCLAGSLLAPRAPLSSAAPK